MIFCQRHPPGVGVTMLALASCGVSRQSNEEKLIFAKGTRLRRGSLFLCVFVPLSLSNFFYFLLKKPLKNFLISYKSYPISPIYFITSILTIIYYILCIWSQWDLVNLLYWIQLEYIMLILTIAIYIAGMNI